MHISNINRLNKEENLQDIGRGLHKEQGITEKSVGFFGQPGAFLDAAMNEVGNGEPVDIQDKAKSLINSTTSNHAEFIANSMDEEVTKQMEEQGISPKDEDVDTLVTVVDKIQLELAKSGEGAPIGADISKEQIQAVVGNSSIAYDMAEKLTNVTKEEAAYLITNEMPPTIANLYQAQSSAYGVKGQKPLDEQMLGQVEKKVSEFTNNHSSKSDVELGLWMVSSGVTFTQESFTYAKELLALDLPMAEDTLNQAIINAAQGGSAPTDAMLLPGYDMVSRAQNATGVIMNATPEQVAELMEQGMSVTIEALENFEARVGDTKKEISDQGILLKARRVLEETRLLMTAKANLSLLKKGIQLEITPLEELVENLKQQEQEYVNAIFAGKEDGAGLFTSVKEQMEKFAQAPAYVLPRISFTEMTLPEVNHQAQNMAVTLEKANTSYETMMTQPRSDMGDNIQKAFRNVGDILVDMGLEVSPANERAVRILGHNGMEITEEAIANMKLKDAQVQELFSNMTPRVVLSMIREGFNPLNVPLHELNEKAAEMKENLDPNGYEKYSEFLVELEHQNEITKEERDSYIGIYRLLHQVAKSDGAAIGAVFMAEEELNMKNLLTQVRNRKATGYERVADDKVGVMEESFTADLSITKQIEAAYQTACVKEALKQVSVGKLEKVAKDGDINAMSPEQLLQAFRDAQGIESEPEVAEYISKQEQNMVRQAVATDRQVMELLQNFDMPKSPENILALQEMLTDRNRMFKTLFGDKGKSDRLKEEIKEIKEKIWEDFSESMSAPEDMAKAQEALADTAERVMEAMVEDVEMTSVDIRELRRMSAQLDIMRERSHREEYAVPVLVSDEYGTVSLKIVRGEEKEGKVGITFETEKLGKVAASFWVANNRLQGYVVSDREETTKDLKKGDEALREKIFKFSDVSLTDGSIAYVTSKDLSLSVFEKGVGESKRYEGNESETDTKTLYGVAKGFLTNIQQISFEE